MSSETAGPGSSRTGARRDTATLIVACAAVLIVLFDYNALLVTLPQTAAGLHTAAAGRTWLISSISLGLAALLLTVGSLADDYGRRRIFTIGTWVFAIATAAGGCVTGTLAFVLARAVQGAAGGAMLTAGMGLVAHAYPTGARRVRATGIWSAMLGLGIAIGPPIAAGLTEAVNWRVCYWLYAGAAVALALCTPHLVAESSAARRRRLDLPGVATLTAGLTLLLAAVVDGRSGWLRPTVWVLLCGAAAMLAGFTVVQARRRDPMFDLGLLRRPAFVVSVTGALCTGIAVVGLMSYLPTVYQLAMGMSPLGTAWLAAFWASVACLVSLQARRLAPRVPANWQVAGGMLLCGTGNLAMLGAVDAHSWHRLVPGFVVSGIGSGLLNAALARLAVSGVPTDRAGMGIGANNAARYIGSSLGIALTVAIVAHGGTGHPGAFGPGSDAALIAATAVTVVGALIAVLVRADRERHDPHPAAEAPRPVGQFMAGSSG